MSNFSWRAAGAGRYAAARLSIWKLDEGSAESHVVAYAHWSDLTSSWEIEKLCVESEASMWNRAQQQKWSHEKIHAQFSQRALSEKRIAELDVEAVQAFVATLPLEAQEIVMPINPNERKPIAPPNPLEPIAFTLPDVASINLRDSEAHEKIRALTDRLEALEEKVTATQEHCNREHANLAASAAANKASLIIHMRSPYHHFYNGGGGFSPKSSDENLNNQD